MGRDAHSTTTDLAIFLQTFLDGGVYAGKRVFSPATVNAMTSNQNVDLKAPWGDLAGLWAAREDRPSAT